MHPSLLRADATSSVGGPRGTFPSISLNRTTSSLTDLGRTTDLLRPLGTVKEEVEEEGIRSKMKMGICTLLEGWVTGLAGGRQHPTRKTARPIVQESACVLWGARGVLYLLRTRTTPSQRLTRRRPSSTARTRGLRRTTVLHLLADRLSSK